MNKLGIAFGGGSGRGLAHLGVIKCLEEVGIKPDVITGTSIGALIGSLYACGLGFAEMEKNARKVINSEDFEKLGFEFFRDEDGNHLLSRLSSYLKERFTYARMAVVPYITERNTLRNVLEKIIPDILIEELPIPFAAVTLDLINGEDKLIKNGPLIDAVLKSASIAGIFPPWEENGMLLVDGGPTCNLPIEAARELGADRVIGIDLSREIKKKLKNKSALSLNFRIDEIVKYRLNRIQAKKADVLIKPNVDSIHWADFTRIQYGIKKGYTATEAKLDAIRRFKPPTLLKKITQLITRR